MPEYSVYIINSDGHFHSAVPLDCADDTEAKEQANSLRTAMMLSFGSATER